MISEEQITKFVALYKARFGVELNQDEAYEKGARLIRLIELAFKPTAEVNNQQADSTKK